MSREAGGVAGVTAAFVQFYRWVFGIGHERNVGGAERTVRYVLGGLGVLAGLALFVVPVLAGAANAVLAVLVLVTGLFLIYEARVQYCPLNDTIGRSTYRGD